MTRASTTTGGRRTPTAVPDRSAASRPPCRRGRRRVRLDHVRPCRTDRRDVHRRAHRALSDRPEHPGHAGLLLAARPRRAVDRQPPEPVQRLQRRRLLLPRQPRSRSRRDPTTATCWCSPRTARRRVRPAAQTTTNQEQLRTGETMNSVLPDSTGRLWFVAKTDGVVGTIARRTGRIARHAPRQRQHWRDRELVRGRRASRRLHRDQPTAVPLHRGCGRTSTRRLVGALPQHPARPSRDRSTTAPARRRR